ncbi:TlpA family protein disulfide reductase [Sedimentibacter hydroxybenzoicus DSM 7310]|uniref:TlpA family protein disulfide reductase n=1 Tax=Sedimentibacter hydroxybenzoicus DSM 7310 TaxID=1123245 RepID=A0A974BK06_SEDHY|nr:TlpA disulfide reductase family protein [Sedimentibacter hydroxybenzoicus]NYB74700.1 TlpA family protein disulfide reductase [Sedimentibacter hydroxybenzoicus DSM 7310]
MKKILILIMAILLVGCSNPIIPDNEDNENPNESENIEKEVEKEAIMAPDFQLESLDGSTIKLSEVIKDKNVILNFWATWCGFCVVEMPDLEKLQEAHADDLLVLTINVGETKEKVQKFVEENNLNLTVVLDEEMKVNNNYGVRSYPTTIAINKKGEAIGGYVGMLTYEQMEQLYGYFEE